ncbi:MAG: hypothetical protein JO307_29340 [Bryobacterales bacterium]|nr:hypothetical protein [Bryobacterales bacterium]MBV9401428.1 hypothetical protein [Bryobacterales bacterium]
MRFYSFLLAFICVAAIPRTVWCQNALPPNSPTPAPTTPAPATPASSGNTFSISQDRQYARPGEMITFTSTVPADWHFSPAFGSVSDDGKNTMFAAYTAPDDIPGECVQMTITATKGSESHSAYFALRKTGKGDYVNKYDVQEPCPGSVIAVAIVGFEQAGGTSAKSDQKFFFDIFDSRPLPFGKNDPVYGPAWRWWASVRIASYPQQVTSPVGQFDLGAGVAAVPVNQLAGFGEFRAGLEKRVSSFKQYFLPVPGGSSERTSLGMVAYFGGLANLNAPGERVNVYNLPDPQTPQGQAFANALPASKYPILSAPNVKYIGLTAPDHQRFYWQYAAGFRLTTRFFDRDGTMMAAPAMFAATFGQNELVTGGQRRGVVGTFEGFYPLPMGPRGKNANLIYLFGRADLRLGGPSIGGTPLILDPALDANKNAISSSNPNVAIIAVPSNRDLYSIGVGMDAIGLVNSIRSKVPKAGTNGK